MRDQIGNIEFWIEGESVIGESEFKDCAVRDHYQAKMEHALHTMFEQHQVFLNRIHFVTSVTKRHREDAIKRTRLFDQMFDFTADRTITLKGNISLTQLKNAVGDILPLTLLHCGRSNILYVQLVSCTDDEFTYPDYGCKCKTNNYRLYQ